MQPNIGAATIITIHVPTSPSRQMPPVQSGQNFSAVGIRRGVGGGILYILSSLIYTDFTENMALV